MRLIKKLYCHKLLCSVLLCLITGCIIFLVSGSEIEYYTNDDYYNERVC